MRIKSATAVATAAIIIIYTSILSAVLLSDKVSPPPGARRQNGLNLTRAYADLHSLTFWPHPYNSHANDEVRSYLLTRLRDIVHQSGGGGGVELDDDVRSNGSWAWVGWSTYFEGNNLLAKITPYGGRDSASGVLFSAHFDSVSTAPGATDDGMGIATLLQLLEYFSKEEVRKKMKRTAIFNFNNGEEDGLNGAHAFLQHPWSNFTNMFLNLEGAASGGRPLLFRSTSLSALRAYHPPHPHANVLSADAFARGLIRSGTDFSIYAGPRQGYDGMQGLDIAFYKGRSRYHTKYDSIPYLDGNEGALWAMMETSLDVGKTLLYNDADASVSTEPSARSVYFDLFGRATVLFRLSALHGFNVGFVILVPVIAFVLYFSEWIAHGNRIRRMQQDEELLENPPSEDNPPATAETLASQGSNARRFSALSAVPSKVADWGRRRWAAWSSTAYWKNLYATHDWTWLRYWVALVLAVGLSALMVFLYSKVNPYIAYSSPYIVFISMFSLAFLAFYVPLSLTWQSVGQPHVITFSDQGPKSPRRLRMLLTQLLITSYIPFFLLIVSLGAAQPLGGTYALTALCLAVFAAWTLCTLEQVFWVFARDAWNDARVLEAWHQRLYVLVGNRNENENENSNGIGTEEAQRQNDENGAGLTVEEESVTEVTPLLEHHAVAVHDDTPEVGWWWFVLLLVCVAVPLIVFSHIGVMLINALSQSITDGDSPVTVYAAMALVSIMLLLPLTPFTPYIHRSLMWIFLAGLIFTTLYTWTAFPFSMDAPLKVFFRQSVELVREPGANGTSGSYVARPRTHLIGPPLYVRRLALSLPSALDNVGTLHCESDPVRPGLDDCEWDSGQSMLPTPGGLKLSPPWDSAEQERKEEGLLAGGKGTILSVADPRNRWIRGSVLRIANSGRLRVWLRGRNTRACRVYLDSDPLHITPPPPTFPPRNPTGADGTQGWSIKNFTVDGPGNTGAWQTGYRIGEVDNIPVKEVRLWSREWDSEFAVDFHLTSPSSNSSSLAATSGDKQAVLGRWTRQNADAKVHGRLACEWSEYASGAGGAFGERSQVKRKRGAGGSIPAYEEVLRFLPSWAVATKVADGLVEVWWRFEL